MCSSSIYALHTTCTYTLTSFFYTKHTAARDIFIFLKDILCIFCLRVQVWRIFACRSSVPSSVGHSGQRGRGRGREGELHYPPGRGKSLTPEGAVHRR